MGPPGDPFANQPQASLAAGETLLKPDVSEFRAMSVSPEFFLAYGIETAYGVLFTDTETQNNAATLVLGQGLAAQIFPEVKAADLVGKKVRLENRIWAIAGVLSAEASHIVLSNGTSLSDMAFTPAAETVIRNGDQVIRFNRGNSSLRFAVGNSTELSQAAVSLTAYFEKTYGVGKVRITVPFDEARLSRDGFDRLLWVIVAFGVGALVMALINLMNMMLTRALRRQAIMGIMGAMGASQRDLLNLQAIEGGLMATGGSLLGIALSLPFYGVLYNAGKNLFGIAGGQAPLDLGVLFVTAPAILILGLVLALIPAWQSSSMPITMALRSE
jgi:ABC-type antimicrobial peptide transport system permease subunit